MIRLNLQAILVTALGLALLSISSTASADIFSFKDTEGFEKCLQNTHLVEAVKTKTGEQRRLLSKLDVQERCLERAKSYLTTERKKLSKKVQEAAVIGSWVKVATKNTARSNAIDLIGLQVSLDARRCNDETIYDVFLSILSTPAHDDAKSLYQRGRSAIVTCLGNKQFKKDFFDEQNATRSSHRYRNVCEILKSKKQIKKCLK
jgi:hypothetical protein